MVKLGKERKVYTPHGSTPTISQTFRRTYLLTAKKSHARAGIWINFLQKVKIVESAQVGGGSRLATEKKQHFSSLNSICWSRSIKMAEC